MTTIKPEVARAAASWWARQLRDDNPDVDNGDLMQSALGSLNRKNALDGVTPEQVTEFEENLVKTLLDEEIRGMDRYIACDYGPPAILAEAAEDAGIESVGSVFPWKTGMWIEENRVLVSEGYGADREEIYTTPEWPPATDAVVADLEITFTITQNAAEAYGVFYLLEDSTKEFQGYDLTLRHIGDLTETGRAETERHDTPAYRIDADVEEALVLATEDFYESRRYHEYGESAEEIVRAKFEAYEHMDLEVHSIDATDLGSVNPVNTVEKILRREDSA